jgi:hypothetical protein
LANSILFTFTPCFPSAVGLRPALPGNNGCRT